jgi:hypothetical protein
VTIRIIENSSNRILQSNVMVDFVPLDINPSPCYGSIAIETNDSCSAAYLTYECCLRCLAVGSTKLRLSLNKAEPII